MKENDIMRTDSEKEEQLLPTRLDQRRQAAQQRSIKRFSWTAFVLLALFVISITVIKGYGMLKNEMGKEMAIRQLEQALKEKDWDVLKTSIRSNVPINEKTLAPLLLYLDKHPKGYKVLRRDLEKQKETKHVYIKGLTSVPPIFKMTVYETKFLLFDQYVFEPALYSFVIRAEADTTVFVNGEKVEGEATKEPFVKKYGPYLPGMYEVTLMENKKKRTKAVVLFGGERLREVKF
ncbi:TcaA second domain-containing protein [Anoxybacteroides amylolyticum]|uniref:TcaA second domain-containing protein n=1 Tax=Anoxybacteroides amylolyticum TaxID=294699 RepID=A0A160F5C3_9BACL|nr:hypothetical protein [Anoxybacillus amylolyticus]ANB61697.1 hypothetical protein GFC30_1779 [Anoxybacillus amylolyticus]